jgi:hypothetical protein
LTADFIVVLPSGKIQKMALMDPVGLSLSKRLIKQCPSLSQNILKNPNPDELLLDDLQSTITGRKVAN